LLLDTYQAADRLAAAAPPSIKPKPTMSQRGVVIEAGIQSMVEEF
jgi:hypothetical protein